MRRPVIAVLERNRAAGTRIARILSAAGDLAPVLLVTDPAALAEHAPALVACDLADLALVRASAAGTPVLVWTAEMGPALEVARRDARVRNIVGWPSFAGIPRADELSLVVRRLLASGQPLPPLQQWFSWGAYHVSCEVATSHRRDEVVHGLGEDLRRAGVGEQSAARAAEVAHELLTNAMYTAPVDSQGRPRFSHQRTSALELPASEAAALEVVFDGQRLAIEVRDRFGRLRDDEVLASLERGQENARREGQGPALDVANGGAGLGLGLVHASAVALMVDVIASQSTRVVWLHDVELTSRDYRTLPASVHLFRNPPEEIA